MIRAVLFDLDETLFDRSASLGAFVTEQFREKDLGRFSGQDAFATRFLELDRRGRVDKLTVYRQLLAGMDCSTGPSAEDLFDDYEANAWRFARPFDGLRDMLDWLQGTGRRTAIVSNGQTHIQLRSLLALNLDHLVETYLISEQEGCRKPDAMIFLRAAERLSVDAAGCAFVGDSPEADMAGARAVGMRTVWFPNGAEWPPDYEWGPDVTISRLAQVPSCISRWDGDDGSAET